MKRVILALAVLVAALGGTMGARAACVTGGDYIRGKSTFTSGTNTVEVTADMFGHSIAGSVSACDDATTSTTPPYGSVTLKINGTTVCQSTVYRLSADPFGFGSGAHMVTQVPNDPDDPSKGTHPVWPECGVDVSWGEIGALPAAEVGTALDADGAHTGVARTATLAGEYWLSGHASAVTIPTGNTGTVFRGHYVKTS